LITVCAQICLSKFKTANLSFFATFDQVRHGEGDYTYADKGTEEEPVQYKGSWENNQKSGIGKQTYKNVGEYYGYWKEGCRHGEGVMTYVNKDVYSGNWANGNKDGQGTYIFFQTKEKYVGTFKNGQLITGKWLYPNGTYFEGNFGHNQPKGQGKWHFANGNVVEGCYSQTKRGDVDDD